MPGTNPTTLARRLKDWARRPSNERNYCTGQLHQIDSALQDPRRVTQLAIGAWMLGAWYLGTGQDRILDGDTGAWDEVRLGASLQRLSMLLRAHGTAQQPRQLAPDLPVVQAANCVAVCLSLDEPGAEPLYETYRALPDDAFDATHAWPLFVRELVSLRSGRRAALTNRLGPYAEVLRHWEGDTELFARRMAELLDRHLDQTLGKPGKPADFEEPSVMLMPVESLAVRAVRAALELRTPKVDHPLCFTNLGTTEPRGPWPTDVVLDRLEARLPRRQRVRR